jgi:hypothetical protein
VNEERTDPKPRRRAIPIHPVLFAVAPIVFVYAYNGTKIPIDPRELLLPIALSLAMTAVLWTVMGFAFGSATRVAPVVSLFLVLFFSYGHVAGALRLNSRTWAVLLPFWALLMAVGAWLAARHSRPAVRGQQFGTTVLLNCIATAILAVNLATGLQAFVHRTPRIERTPRRAIAATGAAHPDIYYIILDGYARADILERIYNYDNSGFLDRLRQMGFYVAGKSRSNYCQTVSSLASSLNLMYLDSIADALGPESRDKRPLVNMLAGSRLMTFLRQQGYAVMAFATGYGPTDFKDAEFYRAPPWAVSEFRNVLLGTTLVPPLLEVLGLRTQFDLHRERILYAFGHLADAVQVEPPVFVFAHIVAPHPPFVFGADGERLNPGGVYHLLDGSHLRRMDRALQSEYVTRYRDQLVFVNTLVLTALQRILAQSTARPYVILQGDHGPGSRLDWESAESTDMAERTSILNAYYFPGQDYSKLYDSITPVNTFRVIISQLFDTTLALLPDRTYFNTFSRPYYFYDVDRPTSPPTFGGPAGREPRVDPVSDKRRPAEE